MFYETRIEFHANKILRAELLQEGMDYAKEMLNHIYDSCSDGIIEGVEVTLQEDNLIVHPGIIKKNGILYHMKQKVRLPFEHSQETVYLKLRFADKSQEEEQIQYLTELVLTTMDTDFPYEMELGRFIAEPGARLQMDYKYYAAIFTKYNQFDVRNVPFAGTGKSTIAPKITALFSRELWERESENMYDIAFCMQGMAGKPIEREVICKYISMRLGRDAMHFNNEQICQAFGQILRLPVQEGRRQTPRRMERKLIVD